MKSWPVILCLLYAGRNSLPAPSPERGGRTSAAQLAARIEAAPQLPLRRTVLSVKLPAGRSIGMVSGLAHDSRTGVTWLIQRGDDAAPVIAVGADGRVLHSFGEGQFTIPHAVRLDREGHVWTVDAGNSKLIEFTPEGKKLMELDVTLPAKSDEAFRGATDIAFAPDGRILVSDGYANARIVEYTPHGSRIRAWGIAGNGPGEFRLPHSVVVDEAGIAYVADRENARIQKFDRTAGGLGEIAGQGRMYAVALSTRGTLWASMSPLGEPPGSPGWLVKMDRASGKLLGYVAVREPGALHCLDVDSEDEPLTDVDNTVVWFRR